MSYQFRNLVFEGGGVKGIAYIGAMKVIEEKGILNNIQRVGGTSAGAINAILVALGFTNEEQRAILQKLDFNNFMDSSWGLFRDSIRLIRNFGWYKGDFFRDWIGQYVREKLGNFNATFQDLENANKLKLYVYGTNLSTHFGEVFSLEHSPTMPIVEAVRMSMSIPLFFKAVRDTKKDIFVDGGVLNNYPIKLFDRKKYIDPENQPAMATERPYYAKENEQFLKKHPASSPYVYNKETLGLRLDSAKEIAAFRYGADLNRQEIGGFSDYIKALVSTIMESQGNVHLHSDDWHRTIYIDTLGVSTIQFDLSESKKKELEDSGRAGAEKYFDWLDNWSIKNEAKPFNLPNS
jgi:NTE family protein